MKPIKFLTLLFISLFFSPTQSKAQDNTGIYVDGTFVDKIDCWTFDHMYMIFPISEKFKKYDDIILQITISYNDGTWQDPNSPIVYVFQVALSQDAFVENFDYSKYGVWKWQRDKKTDGRKAEYSLIGGTLNFSDRTFSRMDLAAVEERRAGKYKGLKRSNYVIYFDVKGRKGTDGYTQIGTGPINHLNDVYLYRSPKIPVNTCLECPWDINAACTVTGKKVELKVENSLAYKDHLGLIKGEASNSTSSSNNTPAKTETKTTGSTTKSNSSTANIAAGIPYTEKHDNGKISEQGFKNKDGQEHGTCKYFDYSGKLEKVLNFSNGLIDGECKYYNDGKLFKTQIYKQGELISEKEH